jgi:hypothetical protein
VSKCFRVRARKRTSELRINEYTPWHLYDSSAA